MMKFGSDDKSNCCAGYKRYKRAGDDPRMRSTEAVATISRSAVTQVQHAVPRSAETCAASVLLKCLCTALNAANGNRTSCGSLLFVLNPFHLNLQEFLFFNDPCSDEVYSDALKVQGSRFTTHPRATVSATSARPASVYSLSRISRRRKPASHGRTSSQQRTKLLLRSTDCTKPSKQKPAASGLF